MRPETPESGWGASCAFCVLGRVHARRVRRFGTVFVPALRFYALAVLMLGIRPDCLRSEPRL